MKIGLDIDGVLRNFVKGVNIAAGFEPEKEWELYTPDWFNNVWPKIKDDNEFWLGLEPIQFPNFYPDGYITKQCTPTWLHKQWLKIHSFPDAPTIIVDHAQSKLPALKFLGIDTYVEDHYEQFIEINAAGIKCYLYNTSYNKDLYDAGLRINSLNDIKY